MQSEQIDQLAAALAGAQAELLPAIKDASNPHLRSKYADLASCWDAIKACLPKHGLSVVQGGCVIGGRDYLKTTLLHSSGQWISGLTPIILGDGKGLTPMQVLGSANSYARRYGLAAICGLTAEDDDGAGSGHPPQQRQAERPRQPERPPRPAPPARPEPDQLDKLTGRYLARLTEKGLATHETETARKFELWNHLATRAMEEQHIHPDSLFDVDGTRSNKLVVKALRGLCGTHAGWLAAEIKSYLDSKQQETAK